ncbi:hypothetical protein NE865_12723 [Phthorimaea operculella]|nr:hypothetical protein NE865_12723 [Phthorimaea operculella]
MAKMAADKETKPTDPLFKGEWSNRRCIDIALSKAFPTSVKDTNIQKNIITRYFNFYLGGKPQKGLSAADLAFAVISIMPQHENNEEFIWENHHYKEDGTMFFLTPEDKLKAEVGKIDIGVESNKKSKIPQHEVKEEKVFPEKLFRTNNELKPQFVNDYVEEDEDLNHSFGSGYENMDDLHDMDDLYENMDDFYENMVDNSIRMSSPKKFFKPPEKPSTSTYQSGAQKPCPIKFPENIKWYSRAPKNKEMEQNKPTYGPVENSAFVASCNKLLDQWEKSQKARIILKYFFGIAALILMRATTKKYTHLVNTFASYKFLSTIAFTTGYLKYSVPHKKCVKNSYRIFNKKDGNIPVMFAKIVINSFHIDALRRENILLQKLNILKLTILSHTADYGFGLLTMLQNIKSKVDSFDINQIIEVTYYDRTAESWKRLHNFWNTYMLSTSKEATHHWARIISPEFFKDLSCSSNFELSVILGVFIENLTNSSEVWQSAWAKSGDDETYMELMKIGKLMYQEYRQTRA